MFSIVDYLPFFVLSEITGGRRVWLLYSSFMLQIDLVELQKLRTWLGGLTS